MVIGTNGIELVDNHSRTRLIGVYFSGSKVTAEKLKQIRKDLKILTSIRSILLSVVTGTVLREIGLKNSLRKKIQPQLISPLSTESDSISLTITKKKPFNNGHIVLTNYIM